MALEFLMKLKIILILHGVDTEKLVENVREMQYSVNVPKNRDEFFRDLENLEEDDFWRKWFPNTIKVRLEKNIRVGLVKTGLYKKIKNLAKKILGK